MEPNELIHETSPYLLQHAYNPVQWYPWGDKALQKAMELNKPILVSIGYSACHWCHVMEKESFENTETAAYMNEHFINIKIDREERPDLDHIYMDAVQAITGSGGWPLNVFLTPSKKPFYGGTYFPPQKAFNRPSWMDVLQNMNEYWQNRQEEVDTQANQLLEHLEKSNNLFFKPSLDGPEGKNNFNIQTAKLIGEHLLKTADTLEGGFGNPPKFLQTGSIQYLIQLSHFTGELKFAAHSIFTLQKMIRGGIYDQLGGGISRYSTDREWLAPHFEKMLYDNALLVITLCEAFDFEKNEAFEKAIHGSIGFVMNELHNGSGGFYTALDADSEGEEGKYYVWQIEEVRNILGEDADMFCQYYDITAKGNWEHKNILHINHEISNLVSTEEINGLDLERKLERCRQKLLSHRKRRVAPSLDDKILLNNNALFITALCRAYASTGKKEYQKAAEEACFFIERFLKNEKGELFHNWKNDRLGVPAFLDDCAYYIDSLIHLQEVTGNQDFLLKAKQYLDYVIDHFSDASGLLFHYSDKQQEDVIVRKTEVYDGAMPSSNAVMASVLARLAIYFHRPEWADRSAKMIANISTAIEKYPGSFANWALLYLAQVTGYKEIAIVGKNAGEILPEVLQLYIPNATMQSSTAGSLHDFPLLQDKPGTDNALIYLCEQYSCKSPVKSGVELAALIKNTSRFPTHPQ